MGSKVSRRILKDYGCFTEIHRPGISVNTSYNPIFFEDEKIPMSVMLQHLIMFYKYGGKQLYYFNTFNGQ